jgi:two-component system, NtrC family, sensor kinase
VNTKKAEKSLRSILTLWFLAFTIIPLAFISGYSTVLYESSLNNELQKRLEGNVREVGVTLAELEGYLVKLGKIHANDPTLVYHVATRNIPASRRVVTEWLKTSPSTSRVVIFDREGRLVVAQVRGQQNDVKSQSNLEAGDVFLADSLIKEINTKGQATARDILPHSGLELVAYTRIVGKDNKTAGYLEEAIELGQPFVIQLKKRLNLEAVIFDEKNQPAASSRDDFFLYPKEFFPEKIGAGTRSFFDITSRDESYGMIVRRIVDSTQKPFVTLGLAASKKESQQVLHRIKLTLLTITILILIFLIPLLIYVSNRVVNPINQLVEATQRMEDGEANIKLEDTSGTEIGILIDSFGRMAKNIQSTQTTLVQSAKMASLGQLVAGVAHELNNPIGFIYSNMAHLRDYVQKLLLVLETAEKNPEKIAEIKKQVEFDYIKDDFFKLIASCEDGARRTRDIVMGLRNFSRLDEAQLKRVSLKEGLQNTIKLLSGELKNRITLHEDYGDRSQVRCYASQLNQVFMNIVSNAAQAIKKQGDIWIKTWEEGPWAYISIKDNGPGIPKSDVDKIFDPFFTTKPVGAGTGLGLSISYGIIQKHDGQIIVKSEVGKGTEFVIKVPVDGPSDALAT